MTTKTDATIHLPDVNAGPWKRLRGLYKRHATFNCDHGNRRHAVLKVYGSGEGEAVIIIRIDGTMHELLLGEYADPFSVANETLLALSNECDCHNNPDGEYNA